MVLPIVTDPNPLLRQKAKPVKKVTKRIKKLAQNMLETMYVADGGWASRASGWCG